MTNIIEEQLKQLPREYREAVSSVKTRPIIESLANRFGLHLDQQAAIEQEAMLVILGFEPGKNFVDNLAKEARIEKVEALKIAEEINEKIFAEIRRNMQENKDRGSAETDTEERDEILREIEKPSIKPNTSSTQAPEQKPKERITVEEIRAMHKRETASEPQSAEAIPPDHRKEAEKSLAESRLSEAVSNPHKKINKEEERRESIKKNYPGGEDPYREAIE